MKFIHLGDLHLGRFLGDFDLIDDQKAILDRVIEMAEQEKADAILIAGDVYDRSVPSEAAVKLFDSFISALAKREIKAFIISGNHDSDERLNFGRELLEMGGIYVKSKYDGTIGKYSLEDEYGMVDIYLMPFIKASQVRYHHPDAEIHNYDDAVRFVIDDACVDESRRNLLVAHQFVAGDAEPRLGGSESVGTLHVGLVERVGADVFSPFDYVALGHLHSSQHVGREGIRYAGSPLKYSLSEAESDKVITVVTLDEKGDVKVELKEASPIRDLRHIRGAMRELLKEENIVDDQDYIYATLTDDAPIDNAMTIFQQHYPNTIKIDYAFMKKDDEGISLDYENVREKPFLELFSDFYQMIYGEEISEDEMEVIQKAAEEEGIIHETN